MTYAQSAALLANYETGFFALKKRAKVRKGESVLITGASGAAGMATVELAKSFGARVIATGRSDKKLEAVKGQGADHVINTSDFTGKALRAAVRSVNDDRDVDVVIDMVGGDHGRDAFRCLGFGGKFIIVGWASNVSSKGGRQGFVPDELPTNIMQMKCLKVMGSPMVIYSMQNPDWRDYQISEILSMAEAGKINPYTSHQYPLDDFKSAAKAKLAGEITGSCVLNFA